MVVYVLSKYRLTQNDIGKKREVKHFPLYYLLLNH